MVRVRMAPKRKKPNSTRSSSSGQGNSFNTADSHGDLDLPALNVLVGKLFKTVNDLVARETRANDVEEDKDEEMTPQENDIAKLQALYQNALAQLRRVEAELATLKASHAGKKTYASATGRAGPSGNPQQHQEQQPPPESRQQQRSRGSTLDEAEQLRRRLNRNEVVIFPRDTEPTEAQVRLLIETAAQITAHSITSVRNVKMKQGGSLWLVQFADWESTRKTLQAYYSLQQLSMDYYQDAKGWGVDQALTPQQLQQRKAEAETFKQLKAAGAFPRYHGADIFVVCTDGLVPASSWDASKKLVTHKHPRPTAGEAAAARAAALSAARTAAAKQASTSDTTAGATRDPSAPPAGLAAGASAGAQGPPAARVGAARTTPAGTAAPSAGGQREKQA